MTQKQSPIKAIAFDFDGTLADSFPVFVHAVEYALRREPFTPKEIEDLRQHSVREAIQMLNVPKWKAPSLLARGTREVDRLQNDITIFPGIAEMLRSLKEDGYRLYIVSSHSEHGIKLFLERYKLIDIFEHIYANAGIFGKPKALRKLQRQFGYSGKECAFVGDEVRDIEAADKAHVHCVSVSWGFNALAALELHNPHAIAHTPQEIVTVVQSFS